VSVVTLKQSATRSADPRQGVLRIAQNLESPKDGALIIHAVMPDGDGEPIRIEPQRVCAALAACGDALARKLSTR
jgi:hypothetical protein